jgi:cation diffusion facilitator CzcD-associated flavoprotein CzcO
MFARTNVPAIAMSFSDAPFAYGPFVPHYVPQQYLSNYFSTHKLDSLLELNTTLEDLTEVKSESREKDNGWKLTLRKRDLVQNVDIWWEEYFDAVVLANGHYTVPYVSIFHVRRQRYNCRKLTSEI